MVKKETTPSSVRCADCKMGTSLTSPFGDPPIVQCKHTLLVRVANSARKCEWYQTKSKKR